MTHPSRILPRPARRRARGPLRRRLAHRPLAALALLAACTVLGPVPATAARSDRVPADASEVGTGSVVLLHGLGRTSGSMGSLEKVLRREGFATCNVDYPSRKHRIDVLAETFVVPAIEACFDGDAPLGFVTHSLGGILVRHIAEQGLLPSIGRVVMLSPPNRGSEIVDRLGDTWLFETINGPAGQELGTDPAISTPLGLGAAPFEVGIITGNRSIDPLFSPMIDGDDDGKVSVERARLDGMADFLVLPATHTFIMRNDVAIEQTIRFLRRGRFDRRGAM